MSEVILHSYDASPFTQRVLRMLGFKDLDWRWVETPMMPPKDDLLALTGGYRGTPVLQIGGDVYIDSQLIALELERRHPRPSLFPAGNEGSALAFGKWSDAFFRAGLDIVLAMRADSWPEAFRKDRELLFADIDFARAGDELAHARAQYRAHASLIERQLADGRAFLDGDQPSLADAQAHPFLWFMRGVLPEVTAELLEGLTHLPAWEQRVAARGEGRRTRIDAESALAEARAAAPGSQGECNLRDADGLAAGSNVRITPVDTRRGEVEGRLVAARPNEIAILRQHARSGAVVVHFPRLGYRVERV